MGEVTGISYPKSGRTWVRAVLRAAGTRITFTHAGHGSRSRELGRPFDGIPERLRAVPIVFIHRNPIDTAVSFFFQVRYKDFARGTLPYYQTFLPLLVGGRLPPSEIDRFVLHPTYGVEKVCRFNRAWLDHLAARQDKIVLTYEGLRADPHAGFLRLFGFIGHDPGDIDAAIAGASFERMRREEEARRPRAFDFLRPDRSRPEARKARRGKIGGYVDYLKPETIAACGAIASRHGFDV